MASGRGNKGKAVKKKPVKKSVPRSPIALATPDFYGNTVVIYEETLLHAAKHSVKAGKDEIGRVIQTPMRIRPSTVEYQTNAYCFERITESTLEHLRIPVHYPPDADIKAGATTGEAKTIYPVDYTNPTSRVGDPIYESPSSILPDPNGSK